MTLSPLPKQMNSDEDGSNEVGTPSISVILPVRNEERFIEATLNDLLRQQYDPRRFELIVVDGESTDQTCKVVEEVAKRHANVHLLHNPQRWSSAARNIGVRAARGACNRVACVRRGYCCGDPEMDFRRYEKNREA